MSKRKNPFFEVKSTDDSSEEEKDFTTSDEDSDTDVEEEEEAPDHKDPNDGEEEEEEDALIKSLRESKKKKSRNAPPDIKLKSDIVDISFHPHNNLIAAGTIEGDFKLFEYSNESNTLRKNFSIHKKSLRSIEFNQTGDKLFTASADKSIKLVDIPSSKVVNRWYKSHSVALYKVKPLSENIFASGDEDGTVKLWDFRVETGRMPILQHKSFDSFVSDFNTDPECRTLVASSGDGTIHSYNIRGKRPDIESEVYDAEFSALTKVRQDTRLVAANGDGSLYLFTWDQFGYHSDVFTGHPDAINDILSVTENVVLTACEDGEIRAVHLYPHRFIGTVGQQEQGHPIERLDVSNSGEIVASTSHDNKIKFWNIGYLEDMEYKKKPKPFKNKMKYKVRRKENKLLQAKEKEFQLPSSHKGNAKDFFKELE